MGQTPEDRREQSRLLMARLRAERAAGDSVRADARKRAASVDLLALGNGGRTVVRVGRHVIGGVTRADGSVLIARVPRSESWIARDVTRDREWSARSEATDARPCRHKRGHVARHSHGAPDVPRWMRRTIDALACTMFGHDPRIGALDRSVIAECAAAFAFGYVPVESFTVRAERWMHERAEHIDGTFRWTTDERGNAVRERVTDGCAECRKGERATTWNTSAPASRVFTTMPLTRATRDANERIRRDWLTVPSDARADARNALRASTFATSDWARVIALALADERMAERERRATRARA